jgi:PAS domain S-box-containing protein
MLANAPPGATPRDTRPRPWTAFATAGVLAALAAAGLVYAPLLLQARAETRAARLDAAAAIGPDAAASLLATSAALREGTVPAPDAVWGPLDAADRELDRLLSGDPSADPPLPPLPAELSAQAGAVRAVLINVRSLAEARILNPEKSGPGTDAARRHSEQTVRLLAEAGDLHGAVLALNDRARGAAERAAAAVLVLAFGLAGAAGWIALGAARRRGVADVAPAAPAPTDDPQAALLSAALAQAAEIIFVADREARIQYVNDAFVEHLGWDRADVVGQYAEILRTDRHDAAFYDAIYEGLREGRAWHGTLHVRRKGGGSLEVEQAITPVRDRKGRITNHVIVARDATRDRALKAQVASVQRLEGLGVLAGGIAHDLNNLLTAVLGNAALARIPEGGEADEFLARIEAAAARASELCAQLMAYAGGARAEHKAMDLSALVRDVSRLLEVTMGPGVRLTLDLADAPPPVEGDPAQLRQVLMNLVVNAAEAVGRGPGEVTVRTGTARMSRQDLARTYDGAELAPGEYAFLEVTDTGCGMDADTRERMFEPFFTTKAAGRGLGMSAVRGIVRAHRGALGVTSRPGTGSTFRLLLPPSGRPVPPAPPEPAGDGWTGSGMVLVVDDEQSVREVACRMLESFGFTAEAAPDGAAALARFGAGPERFVCVLLDVTLPGMEGAEVLRRLRKLRADVPVLLISGYAEEEATARVGQGPSGFLAKPFTPEQLRGRLREALAGAPETPAGPEAGG